MLRNLKIVLIGVVAAWGFVGALGNILDWNQALGAVNTVTSMSSFEGGAESWQATSSTLLSWLGALFIMLSKVATGMLCTISAGRMWRSRAAATAEFAAAKLFGLCGCAVAMVMLFGGFLVIAESWFELWRSTDTIRLALTDAFRYGGMIALIGLFVAMPEDKINR